LQSLRAKDGEIRQAARSAVIRYLPVEILRNTTLSALPLFWLLLFPGLRVWWIYLAWAIVIGAMIGGASFDLPRSSIGGVELAGPPIRTPLRCCFFITLHLAIQSMVVYVFEF
jgi:hypothetical protein